MGDTAAEAAVREAEALRGQGEVAGAVRVLEGGLASTEDPAEVALLCSELAQTHLDDGNVELAQPLLERALKIREEGASAGASGDKSDSDDWDADDDWESNVPQFERASPAQKEAASAAAAPRSSSAASRSTPARSAQPYRPVAAASARAAATVTEQVVVDCSGSRHVLEIEGFHKEESDINLENFLESLGVSTLVSLRRVSDSAAIAVFPNPEAASNALDIVQPGVPYRLVPFSASSPTAKLVTSSDLKPPVARPKSTAVVARRLIGAALGAPEVMKSQTAKAEETKLRAERKAEFAARKAQKERAQQMQDAAWDD